MTMHLPMPAPPKAYREKPDSVAVLRGQLAPLVRVPSTVVEGTYRCSPPLIRPSKLTSKANGGVGKDLSQGWNLNFAVGCTHACPFCVTPETPVLMADLTWRAAGEIQPGDQVLGFDEKTNAGGYRRYRVATVEAVAVRQAPTITLTTAFGEVTCTPDHLWLESSRFRRAARIDSLRLASVPVPPPAFGRDYMMGYLRGAMAGDGTFSRRPGQTHALFRVCDEPFASRFAAFGREMGFQGFRTFTYTAGYAKRPLYGVRTSRVKEVAALEPYGERYPTQDYMRGWLGGAFDAEGANGGGAWLRIHQRVSNRPFWDMATQSLERLAVPFPIEDRKDTGKGGHEHLATIRIGRVSNQLRFIALTQPALERKWSHLRGGALKSAAIEAPVLSRKDAGVRTVVSIQTSTGTLVEGGFLSHNCYVDSIHKRWGVARFGDAVLQRWGDYLLIPENLDEAIEETPWHRWRGKEAMMSSTHDPYLPKLAVAARKILEHALPAGVRLCIQTRSMLVLRDLPLLQEYRDQVRLQVSIATANRGFARVIEPRVPPPERRFDVLRRAKEAGLQVGVILAPIFPAVAARPDFREDLDLMASELETIRPDHIFGESFHVRGSNSQLVAEAIGEALEPNGFDTLAAFHFRRALKRHGLRGVWWPE